MKLFLVPATLAACLLATGASAANCGSDATIQRKLANFGYTVDVATLSNTQKFQVCNALSSQGSRGEKKSNVNAALRTN